MMRHRLVAFSILVLLPGSGISQEKTPNFSGTWRKNYQKSPATREPSEDERLKVEQNGTDLRMTLLVRAKGVDDVMHFHYLIGQDGIPGELHGGSMKSNTHWEGTGL